VVRFDRIRLSARARNLFEEDAEMRRLGFVSLFGLHLAAAVLAQAPTPCAEDPPARRALTAEDARRVADLEKRLADLVAAGKCREAQEPAREVFTIRTRVQGADHWQSADARRAVETLERLTGLPAADQADHARIAPLQKQAAQLLEHGRAAQALPQFQEVLAICRRVLGEDHPETARGYHDVGVAFNALGRYADARPLLEKAWTIRRKQLGDDHPDTAASANDLAGCLYSQARYAEAQPLLEKALAVRRRQLGDEDAATAATMNDLGMILQAQAKYPDAQQLLEQALTVRRRVLGENHRDTALSYNNLALNLNGRGRFAEARPLFEKALTIRRKMLGEDHPDTATSYASVAFNLQAQGQYAEAERPLRQALAIDRHVLGDDHPDTATLFNNLASNFTAQGHYAEAEPLLEKSLATRRRLLGEDHRETAIAYSNLALNLRMQGKPAEAGPFFQKALAVFRRAVGEEHPETGVTYGNLTLALHDQHRDKEAEPLARKSLEITRSKLGENHPWTAMAANCLAGVLDAQGKYGEAEPMFEQVLVVQRRTLGEVHPTTALAYNNRATNLMEQGKFAEATPLYQKAVAAFRESLGPDHPSTAFSQNNVAFNLYFQGRYTEAEKAAAEAVRSFEAARRPVSFTGLERAPFASQQSPVPLLAVLLARNGKPAAAWQQLEASLARGLLDDLAARQSRPLTAAERQQEEQALSELGLLDRQIAALLGPRAGAGAAEQIVRLREHRAQVAARYAELETTLERRYGPAAGQVYDLAKIQARLPDDTALVAWLDYDRKLPRTADPDGEHWACLVRARGEPVWVRLPGSGPEGHWTVADTRLPTEVHRLIVRPPEDVAAPWRAPAEGLYRQRLAPLAGHLAAGNGLPAVRRLIVLPSDALAGIPLEVLLAAREHPEPTYTVSYAPSGTLLAWLHDQRHGAGGPARLLALGDPAFARADTSPVRGAGFARLPGTRRELEAVAKLFPQVDTLLGSDASEERLDQLVEQGRLREYRYLHLATHGLVNPQRPLLSFLALAQDHLPDPLSRILEGKPAYTGRLSAGHILHDWKLDADLVVLSACHSGLGEYEHGEGYLGFAQGLFLAGGRSLVLSEWSVDDNASALVMTRFYQNLLGKRPGLDHPLPKAQALQEATAWLRGLTEEEIKDHVAALPRGTVETKKPALPAHNFAHPYYWAPFILVGDPD
jgi:CHAT domain-containing protein/tetratricopeptide (TPR) repeat protein